MHEPVSDRGGHSGRVKHLSPLSKGQVGGNHGGFLLMPLADDLEKQVGALLPKRKITEFVTNQQVRCGIVMELLQQGMVCLSGNQSIDHIDGSGKEYLHIGIAGRIGDALRQEGFAGPRVANENDIAMSQDKVEMKQLEETRFLILS